MRRFKKNRQRTLEPIPRKIQSSTAAQRPQKPSGCHKRTLQLLMVGLPSIHDFNPAPDGVGKELGSTDAGLFRIGVHPSKQEGFNGNQRWHGLGSRRLSGPAALGRLPPSPLLGRQRTQLFRRDAAGQSVQCFEIIFIRFGLFFIHVYLFRLRRLRFIRGVRSMAWITRITSATSPASMLIQSSTATLSYEISSGVLRT